MTELLIVRHCESAMNCQPDLVGGRSNHTPASERGEHQAELIGRYLRSIGLRPDAVYGSGAVRTNSTAHIALSAAELSIPVIIDQDLLELSQGDYEGKLRSDVYTPEMVAMHNLVDIGGKLPGAESIRDVQMRELRFLERASEAYPDGTILVFGHGLAIRALTGLIQNQTKQEILDTVTDNVSLTSISVNNGQASVNYVGKNVISE